MEKVRSSHLSSSSIEATIIGRSMRTFRWSIFALLLCLLVRPHSGFAYSVTGGRIVDAQGHAVQLRGVNWFGFETTDHVVHGLWPATGRA